MNDNPYQAPQSEQPQPPEAQVPLGLDGCPIPANRWLRFANYIIDYIAMVIMVIVVGVVLIFIDESFIEWFEGDDTRVDLIVGILVTLIYYTSMESLFGRTIGKLITGTKVVNENGQRPSFWQVLGRLFCRFLPFEMFSFLGETSRGWHDSIPNTYVINVRQKE